MAISAATYRFEPQVHDMQRGTTAVGQRPAVYRYGLIAVHRHGNRTHRDLAVQRHPDYGIQVGGCVRHGGRAVRGGVQAGGQRGAYQLRLRPVRRLLC